MIKELIELCLLKITIWLIYVAPEFLIQTNNEPLIQP